MTFTARLLARLSRTMPTTTGTLNRDFPEVSRETDPGDAGTAGDRRGRGSGQRAASTGAAGGEIGGMVADVRPIGEFQMFLNRLRSWRHTIRRLITCRPQCPLVVFVSWPDETGSDIDPRRRWPCCLELHVSRTVTGRRAITNVLGTDRWLWNGSDVRAYHST